MEVEGLPTPLPFREGEGEGEGQSLRPVAGPKNECTAIRGARTTAKGITRPSAPRLSRDRLPRFGWDAGQGIENYDDNKGLGRRDEDD